MRDMVGQRDVYARLEIAVDAAAKRGEPLGHILFDGPPGLGKTTFATCIPRDMGVELQIASGAALAAPKDLIPYLTNAEERSVLFIDEIHRLPKAVEEFLYPAMEDFRIDIDAGRRGERPHDQHAAQAVHADRGHDPHRPALGPAARPLSDARAPRLLHASRNWPRSSAATRAKLQVADRRRGRAGDCRPQPRHAPAGQQPPPLGPRLCPEPAPTAGSPLAVARDALDMQGIDALGLDPQDRKYLETIVRVFRGGPVGVEAVAHTMNLAPDTLVDEVEPFLLRSELVVRTPRGRRLTAAAFEHLGLSLQSTSPRRPGQRSLFRLGVGVGRRTAVLCPTTPHQRLGSDQGRFAGQLQGLVERSGGKTLQTFMNIAPWSTDCRFLGS